MPLAQTRDDRLVRLGIVVRLEAGVFVVNAMKSLLEFFLVASRGCVYGVDDARLGEFDSRQSHRMLAR